MAAAIAFVAEIAALLHGETSLKFVAVAAFAVCSIMPFVALQEPVYGIVANCICAMKLYLRAK